MRNMPSIRRPLGNCHSTLPWGIPYLEEDKTLTELKLWLLFSVTGKIATPNFACGQEAITLYL